MNLKQNAKNPENNVAGVHLPSFSYAQYTMLSLEEIISCHNLLDLHQKK